jgi:hypothetical protein
MANTSVIRLAGKTYGFAVTSTSYASTLIDDTTNDQVNYASFLNVGAGVCSVRFTNYSPCPAAVFPADGTAQEGFVLPPLMEVPIVIAVPTTPFYMTAVCPSGASTTLYVTPCADQS